MRNAMLFSLLSITRLTSDREEAKRTINEYCHDSHDIIELLCNIN